VALTDSAVYLPGTGFIYLAPAETAVPANLVTPAAPWVNLGHTSLDDGLTITRDGGDTETLGTWQNPALRERKDPTTFAITMVAHQVDNEVLSLYFGGGDATGTDSFGVNTTTGTTNRAMYVRIVDGANALGLYLPKVSISSEDDVEVDPEGFLSFPLRATVLQVTGENLMEWLAGNLGVA
jgi:hypothetical protein